MKAVRILNTAIDYDAFLTGLSAARTRVLMLDYDGTLAPFVSERDAAVPYAGVRDCLNAIMVSRLTRLVIISGRSLEDLEKLIGLKQLPELWGSHGLERRLPSGERRQVRLRKEIEDGLKSACSWAEKEGLSRFMERKPGGVAFHWRSRSKTEAARVCSAVTAEWQTRAADYGLTLHEFDGGLELRPANISKADAVRDILASTAGPFLAAYLGDDLTDEDAFRAIHGRGLGILVRTEHRPTAADVWLQPPHELLDFLRGWVD